MGWFWSIFFSAVHDRVLDEYETEELDGYPFRLEDSEVVWRKALEDWDRLSPPDRDLARQRIAPDVRWAFPGKVKKGRPEIGYAWDLGGLRLMRIAWTREPEQFTWAYVPLESIRRFMPKFYRDLIEGDVAEFCSWNWVENLPRRAWVDWTPSFPAD